jgi:hypothetical protein
MSEQLLLTSSRPGGRVHAGRLNDAGDGYVLDCDRQQPALLDVVSAEDGWKLTCRSCQLAKRDAVQQRHEASDVAGMTRRGLRALVNRAAEGDTFALTELVGLQSVLQEAITTAGQVLHAGHGYSYTALAADLGVSRQAARQRFVQRAAAPQLQAAGA